jgi:ribonucleotide monophosphatase NagD (HAD superfamily)
MQHFPGFAPLADRYDGFVLDLWGVIHDGVNAFPHAVDTLRRLRDAGKRTLLLSNVPRPNAAVQTMMRPTCGGPSSASAFFTSARRATCRYWKVCP